jgi:hypothetical protein
VEGVTTREEARALIQGEPAAAQAEPFEITPLGLRVHGHPTLQQWIAFGRKLRGIRSALQWTIGDWLNYGESRHDWGEKYAQALDETEFDYGYLRNMASIAGKFQASRRHDKLSWSHHQAVAALPEPEQDTWLKQAEADHWTRAYLRAQIKPKPDQPSTGNGSEPDSTPSSAPSAPAGQPESEPIAGNGTYSQGSFPVADGARGSLCFQGEFTVVHVSSNRQMLVLIVQPDLLQAIEANQTGNYVFYLDGAEQND